MDKPNLPFINIKGGRDPLLNCDNNRVLARITCSPYKLASQIPAASIAPHVLRNAETRDVCATFRAAIAAAAAQVVTTDRAVIAPKAFNDACPVARVKKGVNEGSKQHNADTDQTRGGKERIPIGRQWSQFLSFPGHLFDRVRASTILYDVKSLPNLLEAAATRSTDELFTTLLATSNFRIERIESHGQSSPPGFWYEQSTAEWVLVVSGAARLEFEGEASIDMPAGSYLNIPSGRRHRVAWTDPDQPTIWLAIHYTTSESK